MKLRIIKHVVLGIILPLTALAQSSEGSHGGDSWVCRNAQGEITSAVLWEFHEAENVGRKLSLSNEKSVRENIQIVEERVRLMKDINLSIAINVESEKFINETADILFSQKPLADVLDAHEVVSKKESPCRSEQVAVRLSQEDQLLYQAEYLVQEQIFRAMKPRDQAGLILHEALYKFSNEQEDSRPARALNLFLASVDFSSHTIPKYFDFRAKVLQNVHFYTMDGYALSTSSYQIDEGIILIKLVSNSNIVVLTPQGIDLEQSWKKSQCEISFKSKDRVKWAYSVVGYNLLRNGKQYENLSKPSAVVQCQDVKNIVVKGDVVKRGIDGSYYINLSRKRPMPVSSFSDVSIKVVSLFDHQVRLQKYLGDTGQEISFESFNIEN